jgi:hypothetical protein
MEHQRSEVEMLNRFKRPSAAMVVACAGVFLGLAGTGFAAVNYAQNANHVDGKNAFTSHRSNDYVAGGLVATYPGGRLKGKLAHRFLADTPTSAPFRQQFDVTDGDAAGTANTVLTTGVGTLTATCADRDPATGAENPASQVTFAAPEGQPVDVVGRAGTDPAVVGADGKATITLGKTDTFEFVAGTDETHQVLIEGAVRHDGVGTPDAKCTVYGTGIESTP